MQFLTHCRNRDVNHCPHPQMSSFCVQLFRTPQSLATTDLFSAAMVWNLPRMACKWNPTVYTLWTLTLAFSTAHLHFISVVARDWFLFIPKECLIVWMHLSLLFYSLLERHWGYCQFGPFIKKKLLETFTNEFLCEHNLFFTELNS